MGTPASRWLDEREQAIWRAYLKMTNLLSAHLNRSLVTKSCLSDGDYGVLVNLSEADGNRMRAFELARQMQWEKSRLSHHLTRMQGRGLVRRALPHRRQKPGASCMRRSCRP
jgi:DNA-binding MarR family transcriptional regulator